MISSILVLDNSLCVWVFAFIITFYSPVDYKHFSNLCLLGYTLQFGSNKGLFFSLLIIFVDNLNVIMLYINYTSLFLKKHTYTQRELN